MAPSGRSGLAQSQPFILSARLSHLRRWIAEGFGEGTETKSGKENKDHAKLVESRAESQGWGVPHHWVPVSAS